MKELLPPAKEFHDYLRFSASSLTAYNYSRNIDSFLRFVSKPLDKLTPLDITRWFSSLEDRGYSARSIWRYGWALRRFFEVMNMNELKLKTPLIAPGMSPEAKWLDEPSTFRLIGRVPVLCVAYDLALRVGELKFLNRKEFNPETGDITVTRLKHKGRPNTYILRLDRWCLEIMNRYLTMHEVRGPLFPVTIPGIQKVFNQRAQQLGFKDYTFHSLRHSRITHIAIHELEEKGVVDELSLSRFAGHQRVESTRTYVHLASKYLAFGRKLDTETAQRRISRSSHP